MVDISILIIYSVHDPGSDIKPTGIHQEKYLDSDEPNPSFPTCTYLDTLPETVLIVEYT